MNAFLRKSLQLRWVLGVGAQFEDTIAIRIPQEAKYGHSLVECFKKLPAILQLNGFCAAPGRFRGLPFVDGGRDHDPFLYGVLFCWMLFSPVPDSRRIQIPLRHQTIRLKTTLQSR